MTFPARASFRRSAFVNVLPFPTTKMKSSARMRSMVAASFLSTAAWYWVSSAATAFLSSSAEALMRFTPTARCAGLVNNAAIQAILISHFAIGFISMLPCSAISIKRAADLPVYCLQVQPHQADQSHDRGLGLRSHRSASRSIEWRRIAGHRNSTACVLANLLPDAIRGELRCDRD